MLSKGWQKNETNKKKSIVIDPFNSFIHHLTRDLSFDTATKTPATIRCETKPKELLFKEVLHPTKCSSLEVVCCGNW